MNGTPWSGPTASPRRTARSASTASPSAASMGVTIAFRAGFSASARFRWLWSTSTGETSPARMSWASSQAPSAVKSSMAGRTLAARAQRHDNVNASRGKRNTGSSRAMP